MEEKIEHAMETGVVLGFKELNFNYYTGETILITVYTRHCNLI